MSFRSTNEIFNFDFQDCVIENVKFVEDSLEFTVTGLLIEPENSQNDNFIKSYLDKTKIKFSKCKILSGLKDGYKRYDVNDKLLDNVEDEYLDVDQIKNVLKYAKGAYLYAFDLNDDSTDEMFSYTFSFEFPNKDEYDDSITKSYQVRIKFAKSDFDWERYLNKYQG